MAYEKNMGIEKVISKLGKIEVFRGDNIMFNKGLLQLIAYSLGASHKKEINADDFKYHKLKIYILRYGGIAVSSDMSLEECELLGYAARKYLGVDKIPDIYPEDAIEELGGGEEIIINLGSSPLEVLEKFFKYYILKEA